MTMYRIFVQQKPSEKCARLAGNVHKKHNMMGCLGYVSNRSHVSDVLSWKCTQEA